MCVRPHVFVRSNFTFPLLGLLAYYGTEVVGCWGYRDVGS